MKIPGTLLRRQTQVQSTVAVDFVRPKIEIEDLYLLPITVSNPEVTLRTIVSNQDSRTWVPLSAACDAIGPDPSRPYKDYLDNCADGQRLDPETSTTIKQSSSGVFELPSNHGADYWPWNHTAKGGTGSDTIKVGGVELTQFDLNFASEVNTSFVHVGLGKDSTLLDRLKKDGHIAARAFSMFQGSNVRYSQDWDPNARDADYPGSIVFGGYDFKKEGDAFMRGDLDASGIPKLFVTGINAHTPDTRVVLDTPYDAEIDTSNPFIFMPRELAEEHFRKHRRNLYNNKGEITNSPVFRGNVTMTVRLASSARVGVQEFNVSLPESIWEFDRSYIGTPKPTKSRYFPIVINTSTSRSKIILGRPFLKAVYLAINYDSNEFQIAPASYSSETEILPFAAVAADKSNRFGSFPTRTGGSGDVTPSTSSSASSTPRPSDTTAGAGRSGVSVAAVGGAVAGGLIALIAILALVLFLLKKKKKQRSWAETHQVSYPDFVTPSTAGITPAAIPSFGPEYSYEPFFKAELPAIEVAYPPAGELPSSPVKGGYYQTPEFGPHEVPASPVVPSTATHVSASRSLESVPEPRP